MWWMAFIGTTILSVGIVSPIPLLVCAVLYILMRPVERPLIETIEAAGQRPLLPNSPGSCLLWVLMMGAGVLFVLMCVAVAMEEMGL